ncbi:MAG TPA: hypothetical protein VGQ44_07550 [Gemmatimonadaceae bacterium]|nr:hypothetical protein [Gemmatimonadaceae bacterium]
MTPPIMTKDTRRLGASIVLAAALFAACSKEAKKGPDSAALGADSSLSRDLAMANHDSAAKPQLKDTAPAPAAAPAPERKRPEPRAHDVKPSTPKPGAAATSVTTPSGNSETKNPAGSEGAKAGGAVGMIAAGTTLNLHASEKVCTNTNAVGDHVSATLDGAVSGTNGASIPSGATVNMTVTELKRSENSNDPIVINFAVNSVTFGGKTYPLDASVTSASIDRIRDESKGKDVQKVAVGAVAGAIAGKLIGKSTKGAVIGGAAGAAAGAGVAAATANYQGCIPAGGPIVVKLNSAATVKA